MALDYENWKAGHFIPTPAKLESMKKAGFPFPDNVETVDVIDVMQKAPELTRNQISPVPQEIDGLTTDEERKRLKRIHTKMQQMAWDYEDWKAGKFIPTPARLKSMKKAGYAFPEFVTVEHGSL